MWFELQGILLLSNSMIRITLLFQDAKMKTKIIPLLNNNLK
jgi:hypothetical protein